MFKAIKMDILVSIIIFILGVFTQEIRKWYLLTRPTRKLWRLKDNDRVCIVTSNTPEETRVDEEEFAITGYVMQYMAADKITSFLKQTYRNIDCTIDMECFLNKANLKENIVSIGGPVNNPISKKILDKITIPFKFEKHDIVDIEKNKRYVANIQNKNIETDYALVISCENPFKKGKRAVIISGCRASGSLIGAEQVVIPSLKHIKIKKNSNFAAIIKAEVINHSTISDTEIIRLKEF